MYPRHALPQLLLAGLLVAAAPLLPAQKKPADPHGGVAGMLVLRCQLTAASGKKDLNVKLEVPSVREAADLDQAVSLGEGLPTLRVKRYIPGAALQQMVVPAKPGTGKPALRVVIKGPKQGFERWVIAGEPGRDRLSSLIGTWSYIAADDDAARNVHYGRFTGAMHRKPTLRVRALGGSRIHELPADMGTRKVFEDPDCTIEVLKFFKDFTVNKAHEPSDASQQLRNPAALVRITKGEKKQERWVLAKMPGFGRPKRGDLPVELALDCPVVGSRKTPDFCLVTIAGKRHEVWRRLGDACTSEPLELGKSLPVPGSKYAFKVDTFQPDGRLVESYAPTTRRFGARTVIMVMAPDAAGAQEPVWLAVGQTKTRKTPAGSLKLTFVKPRLPGGGPRKGH